MIPRIALTLTAISVSLTACSTGLVPQVVPEIGYRMPEFSDELSLAGSCHRIASQFRREVEHDLKRDASSPALPFASFLHSDRLLDSLALEATNDEQAQELLGLMAERGSQVRRQENLLLEQPAFDIHLQRIDECADRFVFEPQFADERMALVERLRLEPAVADEYRDWQRWLGLYALMKPVYQWRIAALHEDEKDAFAADASFSQSVSYQSAALSEQPVPDLASWFDEAYAASSLGLPGLPPEQLGYLFLQHAPQLVVEQQGPQDRLGIPAIMNDEAGIDSSRHAAFYYPSVAVMDGQKLLQLNYVFWFPAREQRSTIDLYSGKFDSLIWRVTLDEKGQALLFDSIHSCGCYHKYFIASQALSERTPADDSEPANIFDVSNQDHSAGKRVFLSGNEHFVVGISEARSESSTQAYDLLPYDALLSLAGAEIPRSLFDRNGILVGSERGERFTLWPTGIRNVGAMRQRGTHAIGFVQRQHFDDPGLLEQYFRRQ